MYGVWLGGAVGEHVVVALPYAFGLSKGSGLPRPAVVLLPWLVLLSSVGTLMAAGGAARGDDEQACCGSAAGAGALYEGATARIDDVATYPAIMGGRAAR